MTDRDTAAMRETSARSRSSAARPRNTRATAPAITATTNATAIPATNARRRRVDLTAFLRLGVYEVAFERRQVGVGRE